MGEMDEESSGSDTGESGNESPDSPGSAPKHAAEEDKEAKNGEPGNLKDALGESDDDEEKRMEKVTPEEDGSREEWKAKSGGRRMISDSETDDEEVGGVSQKGVSVKRKSAAKILSDSDEEEAPSEGLQEENGKSVRKTVRSDSDSSDDGNSDTNVKKIGSTGSQSGSSSESDDELIDIPAPSLNTSSFDQLVKNSDIYGAGSSSEDEGRSSKRRSYSSDDEGAHSDSESTRKKSGKKDKRPPQRKASAAAREKAVQELASETQKLSRQSRVSLPYSRPKQMTLDEFLKKRKEARKPILDTIISTPSLGTLGKGMVTNEELFPDTEKADEEVESMPVDIETVDLSPATACPKSLTDPNAEMLENFENEDPIDVCPTEMKEMDSCTEEIGVDEIVSNDVHNLCKTLNTSKLLSNKPEETELPISEIDVPKNEIRVESEDQIMETTENEVMSSCQVPIELETAHKQNEAELENYLDSLKPKPQRKSIKEMLMSLPQYKDIASLKPKIGGGERQNQNFIEFEMGKSSARDQKLQQQIEKLKNRFVKHALPPSSAKHGEHVKLIIKKKEEDSQGIEHLVENEVDYVRNPLNEEEEAMNFLGTPQNESPKSMAPGVQRTRLRDMLMERIRAQKLKEHEERCKLMAMYNDEVDVDEKDGNCDNEEIIEDDGGSEDDSEVDEEEEEEIEYLLSSTKKKKRSAYVDDEAEDEDASDNGDDGDDDTDDDSDEDDVDNQDEHSEQGESIGKEAHTNIEDAEDSQPKIDDVSLKSMEGENSEGISLNATPVISKPTLNQRTPSDFWVPSKTCSNSRHSDELSPLIPKIRRASDKEKTEIRNSNDHVSADSVVRSLNNVISEAATKFDDLVELCSGKFVSQVNNDASENPDDDEFEDFDFGDDELCVGDNPAKPVTTSCNTPHQVKRTAVDGITPKLCEKIPKTRLSMQFDVEAEKNVVSEDDSGDESAPQQNRSHPSLDTDDEDEIGVQRRKKKRLQFSDDEDDGNQGEPVTSEEDASETEEVVPVPIEKPKQGGLFFNKHGGFKRKFVEDEAELSGSDEGSADEDEKGLNHYEEEEGDEDVLDEAAVRNQVERAHLKRLLDDDDREIRYLQNTYLENGDLHSDKQRERKFRWLSMNGMDDDANMADSDEEQDVENPLEVTQKQEWLEKRKWMSENSHLLESDKDESQSLFSNSRFLRLGKNTIKRLESFVDTSTMESRDMLVTEASNHKRSIFDDIVKARSAAKSSNGLTLTSCSEGMDFSTNLSENNTSMSQPLFEGLSWNNGSNTKKGSFLSRSSLMLTKLAEVTKPGDSVSNIKSNSRNFVFTHVTPPNPEKTDGSNSKVKRVATNAAKLKKCSVQAKKVKVDRSFSTLDEASKGASIFKWL